MLYASSCVTRTRWLERRGWENDMFMHPRTRRLERERTSVSTYWVALLIGRLIPRGFVVKPIWIGRRTDDTDIPVLRCCRKSSDVCSAKALEVTQHKRIAMKFKGVTWFLRCWSYPFRNFELVAASLRFSRLQSSPQLKILFISLHQTT